MFWVFNISWTMGRQGGRVGTVRLAPGDEYSHNGDRRISARRNSGNAIPDHDISRWRPRSEDARELCFWGINCGRLRWIDTRLCFVKIIRMNTFRAKWQLNTSAHMLVAQRNRCTSTWPTQTANTRTDTISVQNAICTTQWHWGSWKFPNWQFATRICVFTCSSFQCSICQSWCVCPG